MRMASITSNWLRLWVVKALRVTKPDEFTGAVEAQAWIDSYSVPVVIEVMLEYGTNLAMGTELDNINEFEEEHAQAGKSAVSSYQKHRGL